MQDITIHNLDDKNVLITEQKQNVPQSQTKYYIASKENADRFVSSRDNEKNLNMFHRAVSVMLSAVSGIYIGAKMKANALTRAIGGTAAAGGVYSGVQALDKCLDGQDIDARVKLYELEEVADDDTRVKMTMDQSKQDSVKVIQSPATEKSE